MKTIVDSSGGSLKSAIVTITYNKVPNLSIFEQAAQQVDYVILCDNSSKPQISQRISQYCSSHPKFIHLFNNANLGISKAYNKAVAYAQKLGVFWLYFFDDDAQFDLNWITLAKNSWQKLEAQRQPVGILSPIVSNDPKYLRSSIGLKTDFSTISSVITSGMFTTMKVFNRCGGYNPDYFLEWADLEFARRVKQSGFLVFRLNRVLIFQAFGRTLDNANPRNKLVNIYIKYSSLVSLKLNKSNTFSTAYSVYSPSRYKDQTANALWSMKHSGIKNLGFRLFLILVHHVVLPRLLRREILSFYKG